MATRNELFKAALDYLYDNGKVAGQRELSALTGITETTISRILNNHVKQPSEDTIRKLNQAFGGMFNVGYFRCEDVPMIKDTESPQSTHEPAPTSIDQSSAINAAISAYVELTNNLKKEIADRLADKDARINDLLAHLREKEDHIATLQSRIADLERQNASLRSLDPTTYPFPIGVAENRNNQNVLP